MSDPTLLPLAGLLAGVDVLAVQPDPAVLPTTMVTGVTADTRTLRAGDLFCCVPGGLVDGHDLAAEAVAAGATALLVERSVPDAGPAVQVVVGPGGVRPALAACAAAFHGHPSNDLTVVGVTGTNGKTTVSHLLAAILDAAGRPTDVIGNLTHDPADGGPPNTPEASVLQARLATSRDAGRSAVVMEVTSIALVRHRVDHVDFAAGVFTNLTQDHLDFHGSFEEYFEAKARLFDGRSRIAVVCSDDEWGRRLLGRLGSDAIAYSMADAGEVTTFTGGSSFRWRGTEISIALEGDHNVVNALAAATTAAALGCPVDAIRAGLASVGSVAGRFEPVEAGQPFAVRVDYAHTPDALVHAIAAARRLAGASEPAGRVVVVFGCGGDRDRAKRPLMARVAADGADVVVLTSDNPRSEDPEAILAEVAAGAPGEVEVEVDRARAIRLAVGRAQPGDVVLVAGKGHETGQEVAGRVLPFDDRAEARTALAELGWASEPATGESGRP